MRKIAHMLLAFIVRDQTRASGQDVSVSIDDTKKSWRCHRDVASLSSGREIMLGGMVGQGTGSAFT
jgi:hypothetical protein